MNTEELDVRVRKIEQRNLRVESDKAWETSWTRKIVLIISTYFVIGLFMFFIGVVDPWINAIVPSIGFFLSTLSLSYIKQWWLKNLYKKK